MTIRQISAADVAAQLAAGSPIVLLDVREPAEHQFCHLPNSVLIPLGELANRYEELTVPDGATLVVYCHHGVRSLRAAGFLEHVGFRDVASMAGGTEAWSLTVDPTLPRY